MHLVDYKVRVINSEAGTAAGVRVIIESRDEHDVWGTVGVSENIIEASWTPWSTPSSTNCARTKQVRRCSLAVVTTAIAFDMPGTMLR